ncbi:MAG: hypothetical protein JW876_05725 [Candidatus Krumholzibacteriota bacterium]|nr:hypothetical protein [Candidatus Krumholzibacteriota bacterium]
MKAVVTMRDGTVRPAGPAGIILAGFFLCVAAVPCAASDETIPVDSWVYPALGTFELIGLASLETTRPLTRLQIMRHVEEIGRRVEEEGIDLTPRQAFLYGRLFHEFNGAALGRPSLREDTAPLVLVEDRDFAAIDLAAGGGLRKSVDDDRGQADGTILPSVLLSLGGNGAVTIETAYRVRIRPERALARGAEASDPRERSWRGVTASLDRGSVSWTGRRWRLSVGRDHVHWGGGEEGLLLSMTAGSLDRVLAEATLGRFTLVAVHALLDGVRPRRLAGHRLVARLGRARIGIGETVVYTDRLFDYAYLLPLGSFYANQYNEKEDDNILWGVDLSVPLARGLFARGELLVDDFQYESDPPAPDRIAFDLSIQAHLRAGRRELELLAGYTFVDIFTYAHKDSLATRYLAGSGQPGADACLGSPLGPDSDRWRLRIAAPVSRRAVLSVDAAVTRRGEGADFREWDRAEDPDPPFPSGRTTTERIAAASCIVDLGGGSNVSAGFGWRFVEAPTGDADDGFGWLEILLDVP